MNAHTPIVADARQARDLVDQLEGHLERIRHLVAAAEIVIEHELGVEAPAAVLGALLVSIEGEAKAAETDQGLAFKLLSATRDFHD